MYFLNNKWNRDKTYPVPSGSPGRYILMHRSLNNSTNTVRAYISFVGTVYLSRPKRRDLTVLRLLFLLLFLTTHLSAEPKKVTLGAGTRSKEELVEDRVLGSSLFAEMLRSNRFSAEQVKQVRELLLTVHQEGLPTEQLLFRLHEGVSKRVDYDLLNRVIARKINWLRQAKQMVDSPYLKGYKINDKISCIHLISELLSRGLTPDEFNEFTDIGRIVNLSLDNVTTRVHKYVVLTETGFTRNFAKEVVTNTINRSLNEVDQITRLIVDLRKSYVSEEIISKTFRDMVTQRKNVTWLRAQVEIYRQDKSAKPIEKTDPVRKEIVDEVKKESEQYGPQRRFNLDKRDVR